MRKSAMVLSGLLVVAALPAAGLASAADAAPKDTGTLGGGAAATTGGAGEDKRPAGPNPYLALLPDPSAVDHAVWSDYLATESRVAERQDGTATTQGEQRRRPPARTVVHQEREPFGARGRNDTAATAERIRGLGTGRRESHAAQVLGSLAASDGAAVALDPNVEDDGAIPLARDTGVGQTVAAVTTSGVVGDGPHGMAGTGTGDFDVYRVRGLAGQQLTVDVDTPEGALDTMALLFTATGELVAFNDDAGDDFGSTIWYDVPADGDYYAFVTGYPAFPVDPFESGSGEGAGSEGPYELTVSQAELDVDVFAVDLEDGDVLGLSVAGSATRLDLLEPDGTQVHGSTQDLTVLYPSESPLPGGGNAVLDHVADVRGWHYVAVRGAAGDYDLTAEVYRPGLDGQRREQTLFLDFDGARVNTKIWGGPGVRQLSPLRSFLPNWGLRESHHKPLVRQVVATVTENLRRDLRRSGVSDDVEIRIRNSLEHRDPFGQDNVSRVIVGGTIAEAGVATIGIPETIDPGNFSQEESAVVLLDIVSSGADELGEASFNYYLTPRSDRVAFVGRALGNLVSHEAGHFFGNWHVDQHNDVRNLMDQGGNFPLLYGAGPDGIGGTRDDWDVDFGEDVFAPDEGFMGLQDTLSRTALVLTD